MLYTEIFMVLKVSFIATTCLATATPLAGTQTMSAPQFARILNLRNELDTRGAFSYSYETENGIKAEARGVVNNAGIPNMEEQVVTGSFSFIADNGEVYTVTYIADSNGFRAFGDHILSSQPAAFPAGAVPPAPGTNFVPASPSPQPPTREELDDLEPWEHRSDLLGLMPPSLPSAGRGPIIFPRERIPRRRQQEFFETIIY